MDRDLLPSAPGLSALPGQAHATVSAGPVQAPRLAWDVASGIARLILTWGQRRRDRRILSRLDPHMLRDIGLSDREANVETAKPFWRA